MFLFKGGRGAVKTTSTSAAPELNEQRRSQQNWLIKLTLTSFCTFTDQNKMLLWIELPATFPENVWEYWFTPSIQTWRSPIPNNVVLVYNIETQLRRIATDLHFSFSARGGDNRGWKRRRWQKLGRQALFVVFRIRRIYISLFLPEEKTTEAENTNNSNNGNLYYFSSHVIKVVYKLLCFSEEGSSGASVMWKLISSSFAVLLFLF